MPFINTTYLPNTAYFPNTIALPGSGYWSATSYAVDTSRAWVADFSYGTGRYENKAERRYVYVRAVRGGQPNTGSFRDNGNGTVTDMVTGLMWQQTTPDNMMTWQQALAYCEGLTLGDHTDWRMPTVKEL